MARQKYLKTVFHDRSRLRELVRDGMAAFASVDFKLIAEDQRARIGDSLDLDAASRDESPEANRWDYVISIPDKQELIGIEPHSAKDSEIGAVIAKKKHATQYLRDHLKDGYRITRWLWVSHGTVSFSKMERARRRLDQMGLNSRVACCAPSDDKQWTSATLELRGPTHYCKIVSHSCRVR